MAREFGARDEQFRVLGTAPPLPSLQKPKAKVRTALLLVLGITLTACSAGDNRLVLDPDPAGSGNASGGVITGSPAGGGAGSDDLVDNSGSGPGSGSGTPDNTSSGGSTSDDEALGDPASGGSGSDSGTSPVVTTSSGGAAASVGDFVLLPSVGTTHLASSKVGTGNPVLSDSQVRTSEFRAISSYDAIRLQSALKWGVNGQGVTIAVIDSGIDENHSELVGNIDRTKSVSVVGGGFNDTSSNAHGTQVAGIAAASRNGFGMHGVAPNANLMAVKVTDNGNLSLAKQVEGMDAAREAGADIINISFGLAGYENMSLENAVRAGIMPTYLVNAYKRGIESDILYTLAAGNSGAAQPEWDGKLAAYGIANGQVLVVGALNAAGNDIASFSNRAGDAKNYFILAPGESLLTTHNDGNYLTKSGTSFAAPAVAGAAALVKSAGPPTLTSRDVVAILLSSADDLGAPGIDSTYGAGRLNVEAALTPQGPRSVAVSSDPSYDRVALDQVSASADGLTADLIAKSELLKRLMFFDAFDRPYISSNTDASVLSAAKAYSQTRENKAASWLMAKDVSRVNRLNDTTKLAVSYKQQTGQQRLSQSSTQDLDQVRLSLETKPNAKGEATISVGSDWDQSWSQFAAGHQTSMPKDLQALGFMNLGSVHNEQGLGLGFKQQLGNDFQLHLGFGAGLSSQTLQPLGETWGQSTNKGRRQLAYAGLQQSVPLMKDAQIHVGAGLAREFNQIMGTALGAALMPQGFAETRFVNLGYQQALSKKWQLGATYSRGHLAKSDVGQDQIAMLRGFTGAELDAASLWLGYAGKNQSLKLGFSRDIGFRSGHMHVRVPTGASYSQDATGRYRAHVEFEDEAIALKTPTRYGLGLSYKRVFNTKGSAEASLELQGRVSGAKGGVAPIQKDAAILFNRKF